MNHGLLSPKNDAMINWVCPVNWLHPLNRGLVSWWLCVPGAMGGSKWLDLCNRNHGTLTSMDPATDWVGPNGRRGGYGALDFDASDDRVVFSETNLGYPYTITGAARLNSTATQVLAWIGNTAAPNRWDDVVCVAGEVWAQTQDNTNNSQSETTALYTVGQWFRFAGIFASTESRQIITSFETAAVSTTARLAPTAHSFAIGRSNDSTPTLYANGMIDDVCLFNVALTESQVKARWALSDQYQSELLNRIALPRYAAEGAAPPAGGTPRHLTLLGVGA